jgi:nucleoid-associated protein YgaU
MGLLSFLKEAGEKLLGESDKQAAADPNAANQTAADAIKNYIATQGLDTSNLTVAFDGASRTVTLSGNVADQATKEKVKVASGNVQGVAAVNDDALNVDSPAPEATFYEVKSGDTLSAISKEQYGEANLYNTIFEANKPMLSSPDRIYPGQKLVIPPQAS